MLKNVRAYLTSLMGSCRRPGKSLWQNSLAEYLISSRDSGAALTYLKYWSLNNYCIGKFLIRDDCYPRTCWCCPDAYQKSLAVYTSEGQQTYEPVWAGQDRVVS